MGLLPENELSKGAGVSLSNLTSGAVMDDSLQTSVPGIFACGNVLHVHDLVDFVSEESFRAGQMAAAYVRGELQPAEILPVKDGPGVRGAVPQQVRKGLKEDVRIMFRPDAVYRNASAVVVSGGKELARKRSLIFTPGEMAVITVKAAQLLQAEDEGLTVRIERKDA